MPVLIALAASLVLRRGDLTRTLPLDEFYVAYQKTALAPGEFVERVVVPRATPGALVRSYKVSKRFDQDISAVCGGYRIVVDNGVVRDARIAYGGVAATPKRALQAERALVGKSWTEESVKAAMAELDRDYAPLTDMRASAGYRRTVTRNLLYRLFLETGECDVVTRVLEPAIAAGSSLR
jgi:xanthine dehydrogenase small subunit